MSYGYIVRAEDGVSVELTEDEFKAANKAIKSMRSKLPDADARAVLDEFNAICTRLPKATKLIAKRSRAISAALKEGYDLTRIFKMVAASDFLCGKNDRKWCANFDWILQPNNLLKISEGQFSASSAPQTFTDGGRYENNGW